MSRVLLVGCGDIGLALARQLIAGGHHVTAIKRSPLAEPVAGLEVVLADVGDTQSLGSLPVAFDQVFVILTPGQRDEQSYRAVYQQGLENLLRYFDTRGGGEPPAGRHWIFVSSTSVYGQTAGEWVDESSPTDPDGFNGRILLAAEQQLWQADAGNTVVRFSGIYGPGRRRLIERVRGGKAVQYRPPYYTNRIHRDDCVAVLVWLLRRRLAGKRLDSLYLASDSEPAPLADVMAWLAEKAACPPPPAADERALPDQNKRARADQNKRCSNRKLLAQGYRFLFDNYREGYATLLNEGDEQCN